MLIAFTNVNLVVIMAQVNGPKDSNLAQMIKQVSNLQNREYIKLCVMI